MGKVGKRPIIGILGGICSGKSTVAAEFAKLGCGLLIDTDKIAHELLDRKDIKESVVSLFGRAILNFEEKIDNKKLADIVFSDSEKLSSINKIIHSFVLKRAEELIEKYNGHSIYEPFGIAQLEPLTFGGICVVSNVCGCAGFLDDVADVKNVIIADYTNLEIRGSADIEDLLQIDRSVRNRIEASVSEKVAKEVVGRLTESEPEIESMIEIGYELAKDMSWDMAVKNYLLVSLEKVLEKQSTIYIKT